MKQDSNPEKGDRVKLVNRRYAGAEGTVSCGLGPYIVIRFDKPLQTTNGSIHEHAFPAMFVEKI